MPIAGQTQAIFFKKNKASFAGGSSVAATSGEAKFMLSMDRRVRWESIDSDDLVTEVITITLPAAVEIDRIFLVNHNFKEYTVQYGDSPTDFVNVRGIDGFLPAGISEFEYSKNTSYYEFDSVNTNKIVINVTKTQQPNVEKYCLIAIVTEEIGSWESPVVRRSPPKISPNIKTAVNENNLVVIQRGIDTFEYGFSIETNESTNDKLLMETLFDSVEPFLVWACGGKSAESGDFTGAAIRGWRLEDVILVSNVTNSLNAGYKKDVTVNAPAGFKVMLREAPELS